MTSQRPLFLCGRLSQPELLTIDDYCPFCLEEEAMDGLIYLIGLIVVIMAILSFLGLR